MTTSQEKLYTHTVNIYAPIDVDYLYVKDISELAYPATPSSSSVKCYRNTKPEVSQDNYIGRMLASGTFVSLCEFNFEASVDVNTNYIIEFTTEGHPDKGEWFGVVGNPKVKNFRANKLTVYAIRAIKPRLI